MTLIDLLMEDVDKKIVMEEIILKFESKINKIILLMNYTEFFELFPVL